MLSVVIEKENNGIVQNIMAFQFPDQGSQGIIQPQQILPAGPLKTCFPDPLTKRFPGWQYIGGLFNVTPGSDAGIGLPGTAWLRQLRQRH